MRQSMNGTVRPERFEGLRVTWTLLGGKYDTVDTQVDMDAR